MKQLIEHFANVQQELLENCECGGACKYIQKTWDSWHGAYEHDCQHPRVEEEEFDDCGAYCDGYTPIPCPTCAEIRELELCWHESIGYDNMWSYGSVCRHCGISNSEMIKMPDKVGHYPQKYPNPDLTTAMHGSKLLVVHIMTVLNLLDDFLNSPWLTTMDLLDGKELCKQAHRFLKEKVV